MNPLPLRQHFDKLSTTAQGIAFIAVLLLCLGAKAQIDPDTVTYVDSVFHDYDAMVDEIDMTISDGFYYPNREWWYSYMYVSDTTPGDSTVKDTTRENSIRTMQQHVIIELHDPITNDKGIIKYYIAEIMKKNHF